LEGDFCPEAVSYEEVYMQFSKELLAQIHIKLDTEGLNALSEKEVIVLLAEQNQESMASEMALSRQTQDKTLEEIAESKEVQNGILQTQNKILEEVTESRQTQDKILEEIVESKEVQNGILQTQNKILKEIAESKEVLIGMLQAQNEMRKEMYEFRQTTEKWQQAQEGKIDKLIYWAKWVIAAGGAVTASVLANLIWEVTTKRLGG